jgi:hypothetical protein
VQLKEKRMRDAINPSEYDRLVAAVRQGKSWDEVRGMLPGVDPSALDRGFRERVLREGGAEEAPPPQVVPENLARVVEHTAPKPRKRG